ncbi:MAG: glycine--tRNA ligase [Verrucomicrobiota bacterium]
MASKDHTDPVRMEKIVSLCKRRGFIFQSAELYGGLNGCWDYGPLGAELKRNLKDYWWRRHVQSREDVVGMDGSILTHQEVLQASGHVGGFSDPMCDDLLTGERLRADQIEPQDGVVVHFDGFEIGEEVHPKSKPFSVLVPNDSGKSLKKATRIASEYYSKLLHGGKRMAPESLDPPISPVRGEVKAVAGTTAYNPSSGVPVTEAREFNLMFQTTMGASAEDNDPSAIAYLRPETAQSIFCQYKNILDSNRVKLPFGIAQIGKSFRNEINPRNYTFRSREFEQMEIEYFCRPEDGMRLTDEWLEERLEFYQEIGIPREKLHLLDVPDGERAFYSKKTYDIEYEFPFGIQELEGVAYRTDYDLGVHQKASGKPLEYFDEETKEKFVPHVVEPSAGCDRTVLALICEAFDEEEVTNDKGKTEVRTVLRFSPKMAPIKAAIFPLLKKNPEQVRLARQIQETLRHRMNVFYDESGAVGRRYRRQDEIGTPFCITVDFETLGENDAALKNTVTVRHRDSMEQERVPVEELAAWLLAKW